MGTSRIAEVAHFILVVYDNYDQMEKGGLFLHLVLNLQKKWHISFSRTTETDRTYNWVTENALSDRDWETNSVFSEFNFR